MTPLPPARILPSLPVKESVLHKLGRGIASNELSHELAHLKHNLVFSSVTSSQDNHNTCKNSGLAVVKHFDPKLPELWERLYDTITKRPKVRLVPKRDEDHYASKMEIFKSMFYLDQIAFVCLASGVRACGATDCLRYRRKMKKVVPVCHSWPGLQDWVLCIISCSLRAMRDMESLLIKVVPGSEDLESIVKQLVMELEDKNQSDNPVNKRRVTLLNNQLQTLLKDKASEAGLHGGYDRSPELFHRCWAHVTACIALTMTTNPVAAHCLGWGSEGSGTREGTGNKSASIDGPRPGQNIYSVEWMSDRSPAPRPAIHVQTFDPLQVGSTAGPSVDVAEVFQLVVWFRNIARNDGKMSIALPWHNDYFIPIASKAVAEASGKISRLGFCQQRVWEVVRNYHDGMIGLVTLVSALEFLPQLGHKGHESCTSGYCEYATQNFTSVTQLHKCPDPKSCTTTTDKMFNQSLLVAALEDNTMTTAWALDGMSLVTKGKSYVSVLHVWSDGTGVGACKAGQVNRCLWYFFVEIAEHLGCDGIWWDTVCIPQDKAAKSTALNNMHHNYSGAKYTIVHDLYLAGIEWERDGCPCIALVLSPWFTRGWTALELLLSNRVSVLFRQGNTYTLKDLDEEILAQHRFLHSHAHWIATDAVKNLRHYSHTLNDGHNLLSVLRARYTSWSRDQSIIAGLMCGLTNHVTLSEKDITKQILVKIKNIRYNSLLHNFQTMSEPQFSWCPPRFVDIPSGTSSGGRSAHLSIQRNGTLFGRWKTWYIPSKSYFDGRRIWPSSTDMYVQTQVQTALQEPEKCLILTWATYDSQGLLVRPKAYKDQPQKGLFCKYIGVVNLCPCGVRKPGFGVDTDLFIGYEPEMVDVGLVDCERIIEQFNSHR